MMKKPIVHREFAEKLLTAVDRPFDYGVYFLFHDWFAEAPSSAIEQYHAELLSNPGVREFIDAGYLPEPLELAALDSCAPGTLGHGYKAFIIENGLEANLGRNYRQFNEKLRAEGALDRLPDDMSYMMLRGFQIHDFLHVLTGFSSKPLGELAQGAFHFAQLRFPYHAIRVAVTTAHVAFVKPAEATRVMDSLVAGWIVGRAAQNTHLVRWEDELHTPLDRLRARMGIDPTTYDSF